LERIRIVLIDMPPLLRDIVRDAIDREPDLDVVAERAAAGLRETVEREEPDFVIVGTDTASETVRAVVGERCSLRALELRSDGKESILYELRPHRVSLGELSPATLVQTIRDLPAWDAAPAIDETS
jgi:DNA-binding NarL/FixJ family response regulator